MEKMIILKLTLLKNGYSAGRVDCDHKTGF